MTQTLRGLTRWLCRGPTELAKAGLTVPQTAETGSIADDGPKQVLCLHDR